MTTAPNPTRDPSEPSPPGPPTAPPPPAWLRFGMLALMIAGMLYWQWSAKARMEHPEIDYSDVYALAEGDKLETVELVGQEVRGELTEPTEVGGRSITRFHALLPPQGDDDLLPLLRSHGVTIRVDRATQPFVVTLLMELLPWILILGGWWWLSQRAQRMLAGAGGPLGSMLGGRSKRFEAVEDVDVTFDDVAGQENAKRDLREVVEFLKEPDRFRRLGGKVPRGVLLVGPPGTGKTLLARAVAGEAKVPFYSISGSEFIELFVGMGASRVRELFSGAKKASPAIVFIDEIDAVGRARGTGLGGGHDEREQTLNQMLAEMDGFERSDMVVVLAATNRPDVLDPALLRPGRFDRRIVVDRPERAARKAILAVHTRGKPLADDVDLDAIAEHTPGFSGADLANLVNEAALHATRRGGEAITKEDFNAAYDKIVLGDEREGKLDDEEKLRVAVHEAGHALAAHFSSHTQPLRRVTIIPRGMALGVTEQSPVADRHIMTEEELRSRLCVLMGGYAAEQTILGTRSSGAEHDLKQATDTAFRMVANYGMSDTIGPLFLQHGSEDPFLGRRIAVDGGASDATIHAVEGEVRRTLEAALGDAKAIIERHRDAHKRLVEALLDHETVDRDELMRIMGAPPSNAPSTRDVLVQDEVHDSPPALS